MKNLKRLAVGVSLVLSIGTAQAAVFTDDVFHVYVGNVDNFLAVTSLKNYSENTEGSWAEQVIQAEINSGFTSNWVKTENVSYAGTSDISYLPLSDTYAFEFANSAEPDYYILKNTDYAALFQNVYSLSWAVFDSSLIVDDNGDYVDMNFGTDGYTISHVTISDPSSPVPEPASLALLAIGLVGVAASKKVRKTA